MCEITLVFTDWKADDIILKLAEYINDGFTLISTHTECSFRDYLKVTVELKNYHK